jgi:hypothetical protein
MISLCFLSQQQWFCVLCTWVVHEFRVSSSLSYVKRSMVTFSWLTAFRTALASLGWLSRARAFSRSPRAICMVSIFLCQSLPKLLCEKPRAWSLHTCRFLTKHLATVVSQALRHQRGSSVRCVDAPCALSSNVYSSRTAWFPTHNWRT